MRKMIVAGLAALFVTANSPIYAQAPAAKVELPTEADVKVLTDLRIELVKGAVQLKPEQTSLWPAVEEAIRHRATVRRARLAKIAAVRNAEREPEPLAIMRLRADTLTDRGAALKKLADAWEPLYKSLDDRQKARLGLLVMYGLRVMQNRFEEEDDDL